MGSRCQWVLLNTKHTKGEMVDAQVTELENFWWWRKAGEYTWIKKKKKIYTRAQRMDQEIGFCGTKALLFSSVEDSDVQDCKKIIIKYPLNLRNFLFSEKMFNL